jgi:hypothetical protein
MYSILESAIDTYRLNRNNKHPEFKKSNMLDSMVDKIADELVHALPHGSGIDCAWSITQKQGLVFECSNAFHAMDQNGFYCGYVDFKVTINLGHLHNRDFIVSVSKEDRKAIEKDYEPSESDLEEYGEEYCNENNPCPYLDDLEDYLYDTIGYSIEDYLLDATIRYAANVFPHRLAQALEKTEGRIPCNNGMVVKE